MTKHRKSAQRARQARKKKRKALKQKAFIQTTNACEEQRDSLLTPIAPYFERNYLRRSNLEREEKRAKERRRSLF